MHLKLPFIIVTITLLVSLCVNIYLLVTPTSTPSTTADQAQYPLIDPYRHSIAQEHFIVNFIPLRKRLQEIIAQNSEVEISIYFEYLNTGAFIWLGQEAKMHPASLTKLPVAMIVAKEAEQGRYSLDRSVKLTDQDRDSRWGNLYQSPPDSTFTLNQLISASLQKSDNTAHNALYRQIDPASVDIFAQEIGIETLFDAQGNIAVREVARIFKSLYSASFLRRDISQQILSDLTKADFAEFIRSGLPPNTLCACKFGIEQRLHTYNDAGLIYFPNRPVVLAITTEPKSLNSDGSSSYSRQQAASLIQKITKEITQFVSQE